MEGRWGNEVDQIRAAAAIIIILELGWGHSDGLARAR